MVSVEEHYEHLLSDVYTWLMGGFAAAREKNLEFFHTKSIKPSSSKIAVDLGAGSGFQSIPLAELGFSVLSVDLSQKLLSELNTNTKQLPITTVNDDI
ncbi:class I SAM-dependent methyltransferase [Alteromonas gracilis]|uniref:class I SAM-dependent methyltransferase n=1 Tax=Alteromonas gracilis TaxID=1479524 RepID=UPI00373504C3